VGELTASIERLKVRSVSASGGFAPLTRGSRYTTSQLYLGGLSTLWRRHCPDVASEIFLRCTDV